jgi:hypothetical protein
MEGEVGAAGTSCHGSFAVRNRFPVLSDIPLEQERNAAVGDFRLAYE